MNLSKIDLSEQVLALLARGELLSAAQLAAATGKSVSSISLALGKLGDRVHRIGAARSTRYALKQDILGLAAQHELVWESPEGVIQHWGQLTHLGNHWLHVRSNHHDWLSHRALPWFLTPIKPQGFLGRIYTRARPDFPSEPDDWSLQQVLYIAAQIQQDPPGAISIGTPTGRLIDEVSSDISQRLNQYDARATQIGTTLPAASSAGGEQPKFLSEYSADNAWQSCIVKFTSPLHTPFGARWRALLMLEQLASQTLRDHGIAASPSRFLQSPQRAYLESIRFDRIGIHGKRHVVAIGAMHDEFVKGSRENWVKTSQSLAQQGLITEPELKAIARIHSFGHFIGNTDMHFGNLSFFVDDVIKPSIRLAPVYDMLPMMWRPDPHFGLSDSPVRPQPLPTGFAAEQEQARQWAIGFWEQATQLDIGADLQAASAESARRLKTNFVDV